MLKLKGLLMTRILPVLALMYLSPVTPAAVVSTKTPPARTETKAKALKGFAREVRRATSAAANADFVLTEASEVKLNGRACRFEDVPRSAVITWIEVDAAAKEVLKVHFSTGE